MHIVILEWISYFQDQRPLHNGPLHEQQLLFIVDDLCRFILHEVVHIGGEFVHPEHELSLDPKYASLISGKTKNFGPALLAFLNVNDVYTLRTFMMDVI